MAEQPPENIPLFPLHNVVLFPHTRVPLRVFEPRYCQMMADALKGDRLLGMIAIRPEFVHEIAENPPLFPVGCVGFISEYRELAEGRFDLILKGTERFRIRHEHPPAGERLYRMAEIELLGNELGEANEKRMKSLREGVLELLGSLTRNSDGQPSLALQNDRLLSLDDATFADAICQALGFEPIEKQGLLEASTVVDRVERLQGLLHFHLAALRSGSNSSPTIH